MYNEGVNDLLQCTEEGKLQKIKIIAYLASIGLDSCDMLAGAGAGGGGGQPAVCCAGHGA